MLASPWRLPDHVRDDIASAFADRLGNNCILISIRDFRWHRQQVLRFCFERRRYFKQRMKQDLLTPLFDVRYRGSVESDRDSQARLGHSFPGTDFTNSLAYEGIELP